VNSEVAAKVGQKTVVESFIWIMISEYLSGRNKIITLNNKNLEALSMLFPEAITCMREINMLRAIVSHCTWSIHNVMYRVTVFFFLLTAINIFVIYDLVYDIFQRIATVIQYKHTTRLGVVHYCYALSHRSKYVSSCTYRIIEPYSISCDYVRPLNARVLKMWYYIVLISQCEINSFEKFPSRLIIFLNIYSSNNNF
jgi:hypothetical protein